VFVTGTYHLTDKVDAYMTAYHNKTSSAFDLAPLPVSSAGGATVSAENYYNPFGVDFSSVAGNKFAFRALPLGLRGGQNGSNNDQFDAGFKGSFNIMDRDWNWDAGFDYGHSSFVTQILGLANLSLLAPSFGPSFLDPATGQVTCGQPGAPIANCIAANPFDVNNPNTIQALKNSLFSPLSTGYTQEKIARLDLNGGLFDLPAGTTQLAIGGSYRKEYIHGIADPALQTQAANSYQCSAGSQCVSSLQGGYNVKDAYAELFIPILKDVPFANALNVTIGDRWSKYSNFGSTNNAKISVEWRPIDDLLLRGNAAEVFRAPTVTEVFGSPASVADKLGSDPCNHFTGAPAGSGPALACAGVPTDGTFVNQDVAQNVQTSVIGSGSTFANFPLGPEHGRTFDFGFVYDPHWLPGFSVNVDVWRIYINDTIAVLGIQSTINLCYGGALTYCPLIHRFTQGGSIGEIAPTTIDPTGNLGRTDTKGVDFGANYRLPETSFGKFAVGVNATYLAQYDNQSAPGIAANQVTNDAGKFLPFGSPGAAACPVPNGAVCLFPRWRAQAHLNWSLGAFDASLRTRFIDKFSMGSGDLTQGVSPAGAAFPGLVLHYGSTVYNDLTLGYNIEPLNTRIDLGVDNVSNKQPPLLYANNTLNANSDPSDFDFVGRYYFARMTVKF
jgi:outer membrane receptor protein involved in Fe transport